MHHPDHVKPLIEQGQAAEREGRREDARRAYEQALHALTSPEQAVTASALLRWVGRTHHGDGNNDAALDCLEAALAVAERCNDVAAVGHAINLQAIVHWQCGRLDTAEALYMKARETALLCGETRLAAMTAQNLGVIGNIRGDLDRALRFYRASLAEFRSLGAAKEVCVVLNNTGILYTDLERWPEAMAAFEETSQIASALGDVSIRIQVEVNRAALFIARNEYTSARDACRWALALCEESGEDQALGEIHKHFGTVARELKEFSRAEEHFELAENAAAARGDRLLLAEIARERGELLRRCGRNREALQQLNRSHRVFTELRAKRDMAEVDRRTARLERYFLDVIRHWGESIESKDQYTQGHCERVADLACALAVRAGLESRELFWFRIGAMIHDVGKLIIPSEVLNKPGRLTEDEWALVRKHPVAGVEMLADADFPADIVAMVRSHHENWDGTGYPDGLKAHEIPRPARILCLADVYDALTSRRSYKPALTHEHAMEIMRAQSATHFDPHLMELFDELMRTRQPATSRQSASSAPASGPAVVVGPLDDLTGVAMRRPFVDAAARMIAERAGSGRVALMVVDVDEFKRINDTHGHLQGDRALRFVADTIREMVGGDGIVGRYAGDEFVVVLPQGSTADARVLGARIGTAVRRAAVPMPEGGVAVFITLSIGVAEADDTHRDFESVFTAADRALYEAKRRGRDTVVCADEIPRALAEPQLNVRQFVGRQPEWQRLSRLLESTLEHGPAIVSVFGEAGVGKSTLVRELSPEVRLRAGSMVVGRSLEADVKRPYAPWAEVIDAIHHLDITPPRAWRELPRIVPALGEVDGDPGTDKYALYEEIRDYLALAAQSRPIVITLDDMQWADAASWDVLEYLMGTVTRERLMFCLTIRSEDLRGVIVERRRRLLRNERYYEITLGRLTETEVAMWVEQVFGQQEVDPEIYRLVYSHTEGNPLLTTQAIRTLVEDHRVQYTDARWVLRERDAIQFPAAAAGLMERRLERLSPSTLRALATAAVIGRTFDIDLVEAAGAGSEDELLNAIDEAVAYAVIDPLPGGDGSMYSFTHSLLVAAAKRAVNPRRLARIHERVANTLAERAPDRIAEIAVHFERAGARDKAHEYALKAGAAAMSVYAYAEARTFFTMAVEMARHEQEASRGWTCLAELAEAEGNYVEAGELCGRALNSLGPTPLPSASLALRRMTVRIKALLGQPPVETIEASEALLAESTRVGDAHEEVSLLGMISQAKTRLGEWAEAELYARRAVEVAERLEDQQLRAAALTRLGTTLIDTRPAEATQSYDAALQLYREQRDRCGEARCCINLGILHSRAGDGLRSEAVYAQGLKAARAAHAGDLTALAALNLGVLHLKGGRPELAAERFEEALELFTTANMEPLRAATLYNMAHLARENGHWDSALTTYQQVAELAAKTGQVDVELGAHAGAGLAALVVGRDAVADEQLRLVLGRVEERGDWWFQGREIVDALRIRLAAHRGDMRFAVEAFHEAMQKALAHDDYAAGWLAAECAKSLSGTNADIAGVIASVAPQIERHGFTGIAARLATVRLFTAAAQAAATQITPTPSKGSEALATRASAA